MACYYTLRRQFCWGESAWCTVCEKLVDGGEVFRSFLLVAGVSLAGL